MHNLKEIRKNFDDFKNALKGRFLKIDFNELKDLDIQNRNDFYEKVECKNDEEEGNTAIVSEVSERERC